MKKTIKKYRAALALLPLLPACFIACEPYEPKTPDMGSLPDIAKYSYSVKETDVPNEMEFLYESSESYQVKWVIYESNGQKTVIGSDRLKRKYTWAGTYGAELIVYNRAGMVTHPIDVVLPENDPAIYEDEVLVNLTGGRVQKYWEWDAATQGHMGCGEPGSQSPNWWNAAPFESEGKGVYDDRLGFVLSPDQGYLLETNGDIFVNESAVGTIDPVNFPEGSKEARTLRYTQPAGESWILSEENGTSFLSFSGKGFPSYLAHPTAMGGKYRIKLLTASQLQLVWEGDGINWFYNFRAVSE